MGTPSEIRGFITKIQKVFFNKKILIYLKRINQLHPPMLAGKLTEKAGEKENSLGEIFPGSY